MACKTATPVVWMAVLTVAAILMAENGRFCMAVDMSGAEGSVVNTAEEAKNRAESWSSWAFNKVSGKLSVNPEDMKQGAEDMMSKASEKASDAKNYAEGTVHSVSHASVEGLEGVKDSTQQLCDEAKQGVGAAYQSVAAKTTAQE